MAHHNKQTAPAKPSKHYPLTPRGDGRWCKKIRGKLHYFTGDSTEAMRQWLLVKDDLIAGRRPRATGDGTTVEDLCDHFINSKKPFVESGELTSRTFADYKATCERMLEAFGRTRLADDLHPQDFEEYRARIAKRWKSVALGNEINRVRIVFKYALAARIIKQPADFGPNFKRPSAKTLRIARAKKGPRMFEADEIRAILATATPQIRCMALLGVNCGFGNADVGGLAIAAIDRQGGWINFPRPKTGIDRRCKLWPETLTAIDAALAVRKKTTAAAVRDLVFVTRFGKPWAKDVADSPVTKEFRKLLDELKLHRPGLGFYALRHTFETIGGEAKDQVAVNAIMGHVDTSMAGAYRERISDSRLIAVAEHVRAWLFPPIQTTGKAAGTKPSKSSGKA